MSAIPDPIDTFKQFDATVEQIAAIREMYNQYDRLWDLIESNIKEGRYLSICRTKLEELSMFVSKGICRESKE